MAGMALMPMSANGAEDEYIHACKVAWDTANTIGGGISKLSSAIGAGEKVLQWTGFLTTPLDLDDIKAEMDRIAAYQDKQHKSDDINDAYSLWHAAITEITENSSVDSNGNIVVDPEMVPFIKDNSTKGVDKILSPTLYCTNLPIFQTLNYGNNSPASYDWRIGMAHALSAVSTRLLAIAATDPAFKSSENIGKYSSELTGIMNCLIQHRDISSTLPSRSPSVSPTWGAAREMELRAAAITSCVASIGLGRSGTSTPRPLPFRSAWTMPG